VGLNLTSFDAMLKTLYTQERVQNLSLNNHPFLDMINKDTNFSGRDKQIPLLYGRSKGRSRTFSKAQAISASANSGVKSAAFYITRVKDYALARVDGETIMAAKADLGAFADAVDVEVKGAIKQIGTSLAHALFRDGTGVIDGFAATADATTATVELLNVDNEDFFEVGDYVAVYDASETAVVEAATLDEARLVGVNRQTGALTINDTSWNAAFGITIAVSTDKILWAGDGSGALTTTKLSGVEAYVPASDPDSTAFFGMDRSVDPQRLGGIRFDGSGYDLEDAYKRALTTAQKNGGSNHVIFVTHLDWMNLENALGTRAIRGSVRTEQNVGYPAIMVSGPKGNAPVVADEDAISGVPHILDMNTWSLNSTGKAPTFLSSIDGLKGLRVTDDDAVEFRIGYYAQVGNSAPGYNLRLTLPS